MKKTAWYEHLTPFLFAVFPIFSLARENLEFINFSSILRSLLFSVLITGVLYLLLSLILKNWRKGGILSGLLAFILLTYGNLYLSLEERLGTPLDHRILIAIVAVFYLAIAAFLIFGVKNAKDLSVAVMSGGLVIVLYLLIAIGSYEIRVVRAQGLTTGSTSNLVSSSITNDGASDLPDIYLILLDGHTRSDVLRDEYGFDNSGFLSQLEEIGFWVADCSHSNYPGTSLSVNSFFEMDYLHHIYTEDYDDLVLPPLNNTSVFQILDNYNYETVTFQNFVFQHFNIKDDIRFSKEDKLFGSITEYEKELVDTSILRLLVDTDGVFPSSWVRPFVDDFYLTHYRDTLYALETLPDLTQIDQRIFVYAHLLVTHDPFVFLADGSFHPSQDYSTEDYVNSVEFIDTALPSIVNEIIQKSEEPPIIIIMGDHGSTVKGTSIENRMKNLFAIYLQGQDPETAGFYEDISPVNVFRLIFNDLLDINYDLLEEKSYEIWNTSELGNLSHRVFPQCNP